MEEPEGGSESSEGTWRPVRTQGSRNRSDNSEVERNLLEGNSDSKTGGCPSKYFCDWFNSENNKDEDDLKSNKPNELEESQEQWKPIEMGSQEGHSKKHEKCRSRQPVKPTRFRDVMMSISMAGPSETVSRNEQPKTITAVRFGKGNNIPHGMKFAIVSKAQGHKDKRGPQKDSSGPSDSSESEESSEEEQPRHPSKKGPARGKKKPQEDPSLLDSSSTSSLSPESESEMSLDETPSPLSTSSEDSESDSN